MAVVLFMVALAFASVPLYDLFCRVTGFGGTTQVAENLPDQVLERRITVKFNADTGRNMPWSFKPEMREIDVRLGERGITAFSAVNNSPAAITGTAIYNVTPPKAGKYFHKIECFCFGEQTLAAKESAHMPVLFFIDPKMDSDPDMNDVSVITLSYTFFKTDTEELESAMQDFYNEESSDIEPHQN